MKPQASFRYSLFAISRFSPGFTLIELLALCVITMLVVMTLGPALARSNSGSRTLQCMNNHRQLCAAWRMNADDNNDRIVYASDDGTQTPPYHQSSTSVSNNNAWTWSKMDFSGQNVYNWDPAADITLRPLWPYTGKDTNFFKCPSDRSFVIVTNQTKPRVRSISMNVYLGGFGGSIATSIVSNINSYQLYFKVSDISVPNKIFVFLDHRADQINWGNFITSMDGYTNVPGAYRFGDFPGFYHNQSCTFSFIDGHVEEKHWLDTRTTPPPSPTGFLNPDNNFPVPYDPDVGWLQDHATRPK